MACDQPLFALAKTIEWDQKDSAGEDDLLVMFGELHIEQAALKTIGSCLAGSGWVEVLSLAGRVESLIRDCGHITRTRLAHQVTAQQICSFFRNRHTGGTSSLLKRGKKLIRFPRVEERKNPRPDSLSTGTSLYNFSS